METTADHPPVEPFRVFDVGGTRAPLYILPFDRDGTCMGPETRAKALEDAHDSNATDVFLFSHGWNNDWRAASAHYVEFIEGYQGLRSTSPPSQAVAYRAVLIGVFWPSTALVLPWEGGPAIAGVDLQEQETARSEEFNRQLAELSGHIDGDALGLLRSPTLDDAAVDRLAKMLAPVWNQFQSSPTGDLAPGNSILPEELKALWQAASMPTDGARPGDSDVDFQGGSVGSKSPAEPAAAGIGTVVLKPRDVVRLFTVLQMKDRAARVGARGISALLRDILDEAPHARVHLVGHSYGCIVMLSAMCYPSTVDLPRPVDSVLLLQGAVNRYCFGKTIPGTKTAGGYRTALRRVVQPILATFSQDDFPLHNVFHLAVRRSIDLGQQQIAAGAEPAAPSRFAALGGYGPAGCEDGECGYTVMPTSGVPYPRPTTERIYGLRADAQIAGHSAINVPGTWWALHQQVDR